MITNELIWHGFEPKEPEPKLDWRATKTEEHPDGIVMTMQPFCAGKRACPPNDGFRYLVQEQGARLLNGRVRVDGRYLTEPDGLASMAHGLLLEVLAPSLTIGCTRTGYSLLGPWQDQAKGVRWSIPLEGPNANEPCTTIGAVEVEEWPDRLDRMANAWLRWAGWQVPPARLRVWVAELPKDHADVPVVKTGVPLPLVLEDGAIWIYPRVSSEHVRQGDVRCLYPDAVDLASAAQKAQEGLQDALKVRSQVWVSPREPRHAALILPLERLTILFPSPADAMVEAQKRGLDIPMGRMLPMR